MNPDHITWSTAAQQSARSHRRMIDRTVMQLSDRELHRRPADSINSVAILLRHLGGNLKSRWTDFLTTDGEKPWRHREQEFQDWTDGRDALLTHFDEGWQCFTEALDRSATIDPSTEVLVRGERQTLAAAITRALTHISYHTGQISLIARMVHDGDWDWLTIAPGQSDTFNRVNWGSTGSRGVFGQEED